MAKNNSLLKKIELFEKLSIYGKRNSFLNRLAQNYDQGPYADWENKTKNLGPTEVLPKSTDNMTLNPDPLAGANQSLPEANKSELWDNPNAPGEPYSKTNPTPISKDIQQKLNDILVPAGKMLPIKTDGDLGPETRKALNAYKATKYPGQNKSDADIITDLKLQVETDKAKAQGTASTNLNPLSPAEQAIRSQTSGVRADKTI